MTGAQCKLVCNCDHDRQNVCEGLNLSKRSGADSRGSQDRAWANEWQKVLVAMRLGATPVPIPNTMVKTQTADGTALETVWESRWPPNLKEKDRGRSAAEVKNKYRQGWATTYQRQPNQQGSAVKSWVYQWSEFKSSFEFWWLINNQSEVYLENCIQRKSMI